MIPYIIGGVVVCLLVLIVLTGYVKAPPDTAYIISGLRNRVLIGKASVKIPILERLDRVTLKLIPIDVKTQLAVPTADFINVQVDAVVNIKISDSPEMLKLAAQNFLNMPPEKIGMILQQVLEGNTREIVGRMTLKEMVNDRKKFAEEVTNNAAPDLKAMGVEIVAFNVQGFSDEAGVIKNLGVENIETIRKDAAIASAKAQKEIAVQKALADQEANDARVKADLEIARQNNELALRQAELKQKEDTQRAIADAAYGIQQQEQRKTIETATVNADIARTEREAELKEKQVAVAKQTLDAEVRAQADADLYKAQKEADARKYAQEQEALAQRAVADLRRYEQEQEAAGILAKGQAEAEAIRQRGIAEADAMKKKAEAYAEYGQAAIAEMVVNVLPQIAQSIAAPLATIDKVSVYAGGDSASAPLTSMAGNVPAVMAKTFETVKDATGVDLVNIVNANSLQAKTDRNVSVNGELAVPMHAPKQDSEVLPEPNSGEAPTEPGAQGDTGAPAVEYL